MSLVVPLLVLLKGKLPFAPLPDTPHLGSGIPDAPPHAELIPTTTGCSTKLWSQAIARLYLDWLPLFELDH
jgi:hypothetical protein